MPKFIDDIKSGIITEITELPECNKADESIKRVPSPLPFQKDSSKDKIDLEYVSCMNKHINTIFHI